jgi:DNA mismatch repair protein MutS2
VENVNPKYLGTLELDKILERLAGHTSFSAGRELALALQPSADIEDVRLWQQQTAEAKMLLSKQPGLSLGGVHDVRPLLRSAKIGAALEPGSLLDIQTTLLGGKVLRRAIASKADQFPQLAAIAQRIEECPKLAAEIGRCISDRGEIVDSASSALARIRRQLAVAHERLLNHLNKLIALPANARYLQEALVTQRAGRYVIPLKAESKGRIPGIVHDQSASGATLFIEPLAVVELGNQWRQLQLDEQHEMERILHELTIAVGEHAAEIQSTVEALAELDLAFAKANYAFELKAVQPDLLEQASRPTTARGAKPAATRLPEYLRLVRARHPLLPADTVVPIDVHLGSEFTILVVTGPNTGGKTVALKTVGLLAAMAQSGLQIPAAEGSELRVFTGLYADIGDEQSIEQSLSTFSSHMTNIIDILAESGENALVLLDELGAGTDPAEGSALGRAILSELLERRIPAMVTTHYTELKLFAQATSGVENAAVEFDVRTLSPTYKLTIGLPGRSNAFSIARRLGLPEPIIAGAKTLISAEDRESDHILDRIRKSRKEMARATQAAQMTLASARRKEKEVRRRLRDMERERRELLAQARQRLHAVQEEQRRLQRTVQQQEVTRQWLDEAAQRLQKLEQEQKAAESVVAMPPPSSEQTQLPQEPLVAGDIVWVSSLSQVGHIIELVDGDAEVQVGAFRARVPAVDLEKRQPTVSPVDKGEVRVELSPRPIPSVELNLRGRRVEDALPELDKYLDGAYLASLPYARIVHGKGTGALRKVVREVLANHPLVASFRPGELNEGGDGVTVVNLVPRSPG